MAASLKQTIANRLNALLSTGPKTSDGKARSSRNARSHGLSRAVGATAPIEWADLIADRKAKWRHDYRPEGEAQDYLFDRLVAESVRLDRCEARIMAARVERAERAAESWDDDRAAEVAALASRISYAPERVQPTLLQSKHGVLWMLDRWEEVADSIRHHDGWTFETWQHALDLLGLPKASRESASPAALDPDDTTAAPGLDLVRQSVDALRSRLHAYLTARDERLRLDAEAGLEAEDPRPIRLLERYAADARRRVSWSLNELRRLQAGASRSSPAPVSAPAPLSSGPPGPRPIRPRKPIPTPSDPSSPSARNEPAVSPLLARNEPDRSPSPTQTAPTTAPLPVRNEPDRSPETPPAGRSPIRLGSAILPVSLNRRARRAQAALSRRS